MAETMTGRGGNRYEARSPAPSTPGRKVFGDGWYVTRIRSAGDLAAEQEMEDRAARRAARDAQDAAAAAS